MGQFSVEISPPSGSVLSGNQHRVHIVNDCATMAMGLEKLPIEDKICLFGNEAIKCDTSLLMTVGDGLGMSVKIRDDHSKPIIQPTEFGLGRIYADTPECIEVFEFMRLNYGTLKREHIISLSGVADIYASKKCMLLAQTDRPDAKKVIELAISGDPDAAFAVRVSINALGRAIADVVLTTGARGGVYLTGPYIELFRYIVNWRDLSAAIYNSGHFYEYLENVPIYIVKYDNLCLFGLTTLFE